MADQNLSFHNSESDTEEAISSMPQDELTAPSVEEETPVEEEDTEDPEEEKKILFMKAAQGYGMIFGFGVGYILSGILSELGLQAGKFECVIVCMFAGIAIGSFLSNRKNK